MAVRAARQRALIKCWQLTAGHVPGPRVLSLSRSPGTLHRALLGPVDVLGPCRVSCGADGGGAGDDGGGRSSGVNASSSRTHALLMGLANKNDRHATHLSPRAVV